MKNNIQESEFKRILQLHENKRLHERKLLNEQTVKDGLLDKIHTYCIDGQIEPTGIPKPEYEYGIKRPSVKNPGKFVYFMNDMTVYGNLDGKGLKKLGTWSCFPVSDAKKKEIDKLKSEQGWVDYNDFDTKGMSVLGIQNNVYDTKDIDTGYFKITLYKPKGKGTFVNAQGAYTTDQKNVIKAWQDAGYKLESELTSLNKNWPSKEVELDPSTKIRMYYDPSKIVGVERTVKNKVQQSADAQDIEKNRCRARLEKYYQSFEQKDVLSINEFTENKNVTQRCVDQYHPNWGGLRPKHFADMAEKLIYGIGSYDEAAEWKLTPPRRFNR